MHLNTRKKFLGRVGGGSTRFQGDGLKLPVKDLLFPYALNMSKTFGLQLIRKLRMLQPGALIQTNLKISFLLQFEYWIKELGNKLL